MIDKNKNYIEIFEVNTNKISNNISFKKVQHINLAIKELDSWCDIFIERRDNEKKQTKLSQWSA